MICQHLVPPKNWRLCSKCGAHLRGAELSEARRRRAVVEKEAEQQARDLAYVEKRVEAPKNPAPHSRPSPRHRLNRLILAGLALSMAGFARVRDE